jgi:hypothetical protein
VIFYAYVGLAAPGEPMPAQGYAAMMIGVVLSLAVGIGLMALLFYSSRRGYDEPPRLKDRLTPRLLRHPRHSLPGTVARDTRSRLMHETIPHLVETSFRIAWDYLQGTGELDGYDAAARLLLGTIEYTIRQGERRQLLIANNAISAYQRARAERFLMAAS